MQQPGEAVVRGDPETSNERHATVSRRPIKVAQYCVGVDGCGWLVDQLRELRDRFGYDVCAILPKAEGSLPERLRALGIRVLASPLDVGSHWKLWTIPRQVADLARLMAREQIDILQTQVFVSTIFGRVAAWLADIPIRLAMIAGPFHLEAPVSRDIERRTWWMDTMLITTCRFIQELCEGIGIPRSRLRLIYYGADAARFDPSAPYVGHLRQDLGIPEECPIVGMVAYFYSGPPDDQAPWDLARGWWPPGLTESPKGHRCLIRAVPRVLEEFPRCKFVLVGPTWYEAGEQEKRDLEALVAELGLRDSVIFAGRVEDVRAAYHGFDVVVEPSLSECLDGSIEALLMEVPTIASRVGGLPDSVRHEETGILVSPANSAELAAAIIDLLKDRDKAARLAANGRRLMLERFTLERTVNDLHDLYTELLAARSHERPRRVVCFLRRLVAGALFHFLSWRVLPQSDGGRFSHPFARRKLGVRSALARIKNGIRSRLVLLYGRFRGCLSRVLPAAVKRACRRWGPR